MDDIRLRLARLPAADIRGLYSVGLSPATKKRRDICGDYFRQGKPSIRLYSYSRDLRYKLPPWCKPGDAERSYAAELAYGMRVVRLGARMWLHWDAPGLRAYYVDYLLLHEVGHHVYHNSRAAHGLPYRPFTRESEQFADAYAARVSGRHGADATARQGG